MDHHVLNDGQHKWYVGTKALSRVVESKGVDSGSQATKVKESFSHDKGTRTWTRRLYSLRQEEIGNSTDMELGAIAKLGEYCNEWIRVDNVDTLTR